MTKDLTIYTTKTCSKCQMLKKILDTKSIMYMIEENMDKINEKAQQEGVSELPILVVKDIDKEGLETVYSGSDAIMHGRGL